MSNYPAGSMRGSGIYTSEFVRSMDCEAELPCAICDGEAEGECPEEGEHFCTFSGPVDITVSDFGDGFWTCPLCDKEYENIDLDDPWDYEDYDR